VPPALITVRDPHELGEALPRAGVVLGRPVLVCVGGAGGMTEDVESAVAALATDLLAPELDTLGAAVVDGGTDAGLMRAIGRARSLAGAEFPLIGVVAEGTVTLGVDADPRPGTAGPEPHHTHLVVVPGDSWGDESPWLSQVADIVAAGERSATLLVNGGGITLDDAEHSLRAGRPLLVLAGSGRVADAILGAREAGTTTGQAGSIAASPLTHVVRLDDPRGVVSAIGLLLGGD